MIARTELADRPGYWHLDEGVKVGGLFIPPGFIWDLASKPPWARWAGYRADDRRTEKGSLIHDLLYYLHSKTRPEADLLYREQAIADGYPKRKAWVEWMAIRAFGASHWDNDADDLKLLRQSCRNWYAGGHAEFADWVIKLTGI